MAITKERLQDLIEKGATVYFAYKELNKVHPIDLGNPPQEVDFYGDLVQTEYEVSECLEQNFIELKDNFYAWELEYLYEHKADAEWDLEFDKGRITRTEELNLPRYSKGIVYTFKDRQNQEYELRMFEGGNITLWKTLNMDIVMDWNNNYKLKEKICL